MNAKFRRSARAQLQRIVESEPELKHAILTSQGGVVAAWPLRPVFRIVALGAANPDLLMVFGRTTEPIQNNLLSGTVSHLSRGQLLTIPIDGKLSLKLLFSPTIDIGAYAREVVQIVSEVRATLKLN